ncbi:MAG: invasion associated locus B family protein [Pseudomonadota bacterium]
MSSFLWGLSLGLALAIVSSLPSTGALAPRAWAQDEPAAEEPTEEAVEEPIEVNYPTTGNPQVYGEWSVRCTGEGGEATACEAYQSLFLAENQQRILHVAIGSANEDQDPVAIIIAPLGVSLPAGLELRIDNSWPIEFDYGSCQEDGCRAGRSLEPSMLGAMQAGVEMQVAVTETTGRQIVIPMSLIGFTAAYSAAQRLQ